VHPSFSPVPTARVAAKLVVRPLPQVTVAVESVATSLISTVGPVPARPTVLVGERPLNELAASVPERVVRPPSPASAIL